VLNKNKPSKKKKEEWEEIVFPKLKKSSRVKVFVRKRKVRSEKNPKPRHATSE
jgi:hypothetical protein